MGSQLVPPPSAFNYIESQRDEFQLSHDLTEIVLQFPSTASQITPRLNPNCMKIDHCVIEYRQQVPINASGTVKVGKFPEQTAWTEPLNPLQTVLGTFPKKNGNKKSPTYFFHHRFLFPQYERTPIPAVGSVNPFPGFKGKLKLSSAKPVGYPFLGAPAVRISAKQFCEKALDFWPLGFRKWKERRVKSALSFRFGLRAPIEIYSGDFWAPKSVIGPTNRNGDLDIEEELLPSRELTRLGTNILDPGESASIVGIQRSQSNITMSMSQLNELVRSTVHECIKTSCIPSAPKSLS
uniref:Movement protein BC1 n=1 Tax=Squash leaf curl virus TaxID=10829 RepID=T1W2F8_SLCV|nr:BC1 [Squash leaf curl virus]